MNSLKTVVVVTILLGVMYAVYTAINNGTGLPLAGRDSWPAGDGAAKNGGAAPQPGAAPSMDIQMNIPGEPPTAPTAPRPFSSGPGAGPTNPPAARSGSFPSASTAFSPGLAQPPATASVQPGPVPSTFPTPNSAPPAFTRDRDRQPPRTASASAPAPNGGARETQSPRPSDGDVRPEFLAMMETARKRLDAGQFADVLKELSQLYANPELTAEESRRLTELLDQLAGTVVYSRQHMLERPYVVQAGDTPERIASQYKVSWELLAKINGIRDPRQLQPGRQLKVVRGPFEATVYVDLFELVLQVDGLYAGRFPIGLGRDEPRLEGKYTVREKTADSPMGKMWVGLDGRIGLHGTDDPRNLRRADNRGCICLGDRDIGDVYDILSVGSPVTVKRSR